MTSMFAELAYVKAAFQQRAVCAALGFPLDLNGIPAPIALPGNGTGGEGALSRSLPENFVALSRPNGSLPNQQQPSELNPDRARCVLPMREIDNFHSSEIAGV